MRTLIDIGDPQVRALDTLGAARNQSRAALVREAVAAFLARNSGTQPEDAFGLWGCRQDGLEYQERIRQDW